MGSQAFIKLTFKLFFIVTRLDEDCHTHNVGFFWVRSNRSCVILQARKENCYNLFPLLLIVHSHPWLPLRISNCFTACVYNTKGLPTWLSGKESTCHCRRCQFDPWVRKMPWRRKWQPTPVFLPEVSPWTEKPGGLYPMGSQRAGHDWVT